MSNSFAILWTIAHQVPLSNGFPRQEYWSGWPLPSPGDLPDTGIKPVSPALVGRFFTTEPPGKPPMIVFSSVQSLSRVRLFVTPWIAARQAALSITNSGSSLRLMSIESVIPSSLLILCRPLFSSCSQSLPASESFSNESTLHMRWPKYWSFSFSIILPKKSQA